MARAARAARTSRLRVSPGTRERSHRPATPLGPCWFARLVGATSSPRGLQPFEAQSDHRCPTEHAAQVQGLHAFGHIERHTGQNVLSEGERGVSGRARPWFSPASHYEGLVRMPEQPSAFPDTRHRAGPGTRTGSAGASGLRLAAAP